MTNSSSDNTATDINGYDRLDHILSMLVRHEDAPAQQKFDYFKAKELFKEKQDSKDIKDFDLLNIYSISRKAYEENIISTGDFDQDVVKYKSVMAEQVARNPVLEELLSYIENDKEQTVARIDLQKNRACRKDVTQQTLSAFEQSAYDVLRLKAMPLGVLEKEIDLFSSWNLTGKMAETRQEILGRLNERLKSEKEAVSTISIKTLGKN